MPITRTAGAAPRVALSMGPGKLAGLRRGDRLELSSEVQITVDCDKPSPRCAGRPLRLRPERHRHAGAGQAQVTGGAPAGDRAAPAALPPAAAKPPAPLPGGLRPDHAGRRRLPVRARPLLRERRRLRLEPPRPRRPADDHRRQQAQRAHRPEQGPPERDPAGTRGEGRAPADVEAAPRVAAPAPAAQGGAVAEGRRAEARRRARGRRGAALRRAPARLQRPRRRPAGRRPRAARDQPDAGWSAARSGCRGW